MRLKHYKLSSLLKEFDETTSDGRKLRSIVKMNAHGDLILLQTPIKVELPFSGGTDVEDECAV